MRDSWLPGSPGKGGGRFDPARPLHDSWMREKPADPPPTLADDGSQSGPAVQSNVASLTVSDSALGDSVGLVVATSFVETSPAAANVPQTGSVLVTTGPSTWTYPVAASGPVAASSFMATSGPVAASGLVTSGLTASSPMGTPASLGGQQIERPVVAGPPDAGRNLNFVPSGSVGGRLGSIDVTKWGYDEAATDEHPPSDQPDNVETNGRNVSSMTPERMAPESPDGNLETGLIDLTSAVTDPVQCIYPVVAASEGNDSGSSGNPGSVPTPDAPLLVDLLQGRDRAFELAVAGDANDAASLHQDPSGGHASLSSVVPDLSSITDTTLSASGNSTSFSQVAPKLSPTCAASPATAAKEPSSGLFTAGSVKTWSKSLLSFVAVVMVGRKLAKRQSEDTRSKPGSMRHLTTPRLP